MLVRSYLGSSFFFPCCIYLFVFNSVEIVCIVKGEAQKSPLLWRFSRGGWFSQGLEIPIQDPLKLIQPPMFACTLYKSICLYNAAGLHVVDACPLWLLLLLLLLCVALEGACLFVSLFNLMVVATVRVVSE